MNPTKVNRDRLDQLTDLPNIGHRSQGTWNSSESSRQGPSCDPLEMYVRDTTYFSVIADEWPEVKAALMKRLESFE
jgi:hypothetical protein